MKFGEVDVDLLSEWSFRMVAPLRFINWQMERSEPVQAFVTRVWSCPLALMLLVDLAAVAFAGLKVVENKEVVAAITLTEFLQLLAAPLFIWTLLKAFQAPVGLEMVVTAYTPTILFAPIFQTLTVGVLVGQYHVAEALIANSADVREAFDYAIHNLPKLRALMPNPIPVISPVTAFVAEFGSLLLTVLTCETLAWYGRHDRLRVYLAVCVATALAGIPQLIFHLAQIALTAKIATLQG